jgi:hypothetical protein
MLSSIWKLVPSRAKNPDAARRLEDLPARILADLNLTTELGSDFLSADSIRNRKLPPSPTF